MSVEADTLRLILERDETAFGRIVHGHLNGKTPGQIATGLRESRGLAMDTSMVRSYTKSITVIVDGDISAVTANEARHVGGKIRNLLSMDPSPNVAAHLRRVLDELDRIAASGSVHRRPREQAPCPKCHLTICDC